MRKLDIPIQTSSLEGSVGCFTDTAATESDTVIEIIWRVTENVLSGLHATNDPNLESIAASLLFDTVAQ